MANLIYPAFKRSLGDGVFALASDTLRLALLTSAHTPNAGHTVYADLAEQEVSGTGYTSGGKALAGVTWTLSGDAAVLDADDPSWTEATVTARFAAVYADKTVGALTGPLVCLLDFGEEKGVTGGTFTVQFDTGGVVVMR
ncbi:conserved hypothetical protein [Solidesulfovibrio fructosivorans JJ]]|uniref:Uncharacterized protein n=1 Tax=Solidesulfovibrio fructosivorans JJ] TaxID=596151 RepID=E1JS44_SOLFR|nr:hypothetical protein [Solidesulfovibrio fructosivorans]EFL52813.1 conserved hypothetical protein [Solidesulfovibrio fructosivorans JJ]]